MAANAPKIIHPLRFDSYYELKESAVNIDKQLLNSLKRIDNHRRFKYFSEIEREARMKMQEGDEESAYIMFNRGMAIFRMMKDSMDDAFRRSKDGNLFYTTSERLLLDFDKVTESLKKRFTIRHRQQIDAEITHFNSLSIGLEGDCSTLPDVSAFNTHVQPAEIVRFVRKGNNALVLDYRDNQSESIEYKNSHGTIKVVHINRRDIMPGSLLHSLFKALDISVRPILENISHFDIVILLGDINDITKEKGTKTFILVEALTTYNFHYKLKRSPVIIEGGFINWKNAYPYYVNESYDVPRFEKSFEEQFAVWIDEAKKAHELHIQYPSLTAFNNESVHCQPLEIRQDRPGEDIHNHQNLRNCTKTSDLLYPSALIANRKSSIFASGGTSKAISSRDLSSQRTKGTIADEYKQISKKTVQIPIIDRSKKPQDIPIKSIADQSHHSPIISDRETRSAHPNKENYAPVEGRRRSTSPFPQVLGGEGLSQNNDQNNGRHHPIDGTFFGPPHPSRRLLPSGTFQGSAPTRLPVQNQQQTHMPADSSADLFSNSYAMSSQRIAHDSIYKKTPLGHTGLFNMGNTCFMNATLQPLFHAPGFSLLFRNRKAGPYINVKSKFGTRGIISGCFSALIDLMWSGNYNAIKPAFFLDIFAKRVNAELADRRQHDAQEFQIYLLDALHEDTNSVNTRQPFEQNYDSRNLRDSAADFFKRSKLFSSSPVNDLFNLTTIAVIQCKTCNTTSVRFEAVNQISVELPDNGDCLKLKDCLAAHFSTTDNWDCPQCKGKQPATRSTKIWEIPKLLIIHLKRFSVNDRYFVKNEVEVAFDVNGLDMSSYIHSESPLKNATYNLYAVTNHSGRLNSGHYTSQVINFSTGNDWLNFDDDVSAPCSAPAPMSKKVFLLYYKLSNSQRK